MSTTNRSHEDSKSDNKPLAVSDSAEANPSSATSKLEASDAGTCGENDAPLVEQQQSIMNLFRSALNPNGENPQIDEYLTSTFSYVQNVFNKMKTAEDKDVAAKEIADDLSSRFDKWVSEKENKKKEAGQGDPEKAESTGNQDDSENPKIQEVD